MVDTVNVCLICRRILAGSDLRKKFILCCRVHPCRFKLFACFKKTNFYQQNFCTPR